MIWVIAHTWKVMMPLIKVKMVMFCILEDNFKNLSMQIAIYVWTLFPWPSNFVLISVLFRHDIGLAMVEDTIYNVEWNKKNIQNFTYVRLICKSPHPCSNFRYTSKNLKIFFEVRNPILRSAPISDPHRLSWGNIVFGTKYYNKVLRYQCFGIARLGWLWWVNILLHCCIYILLWHCLFTIQLLLEILWIILVFEIQLLLLLGSQVNDISVRSLLEMML